MIRRFFTSAFGFLLSVSSLAGAAVAQDAASGWQHIGPLVSGDVRAVIDYQVRSTTPDGSVVTEGPSSFRDEAAPLWVNVQRTDLQAGDRVFVQLISYDRSCYRGECTDTQVIAQRDLEFAEPGRFTGGLAPLTLRYQLNDGYAITSRNQTAADLVIWINGVLYKGSDGRNLRFTMPD